jgi:hypothetical protein
MNYFFTLLLISALCVQAEPPPHDYKRYSVNEYAHKIAEQFSALAQNT